MEQDVALASLRSKLQELTEVESSVCSSEYEALFSERLHSIREEFPNSIQIQTSKEPLARYRCAEYAFGLYDDNSYQYIKLNSREEIAADRGFVSWLLEHCHLSEVPTSNAKAGDLIFYFENSEWQHVGILSTNGRIISKWGNGLLCKHDPLEVPLNYGCPLSCWEPLRAETAYLLFTEYAKEKGIPFDG